MSSSDSDDGVPLSSRVASAKISVRRNSNDSDNIPLSKRHILSGDGYSSDSGSESDQPLSKKVKVANGSSPEPQPNKGGSRNTSNKKTTSSKSKINTTNGNSNKGGKANNNNSNSHSRSRIKKEPASAKCASVKSKKIKSDLVDRKPFIKAESGQASASSRDGSTFDENEEYKWWLDDANGDGDQKWSTLEHNGVLFPPPYEPHGIPLLYRGKEVKLPPAAEEVATFFAALVGTDHGNNPIFQNNFFSDFKSVLSDTMPKSPIKEFKHCDFSLIRVHLDEKALKRKSMTKAEKEALKKEKQALEEKYSYCVMDGRREKVGNFRIEPPDLFRGRGAHPKTGMLKRRVLPEQVTINIGKDAKIPDPPPGHKWGNIVHDTTVTWLAMWKENVNGNIKYVFLAAGSSIKGQSDMRKFDKARNLKLCIDSIRKQYTKDLKNEVMAERQRATALYLIDRFALRAGNEKGDDEADTVGCCSLRCEHINLEPPNIVHFDFLGKDSIRYQRTTEVDRQVWKNLRIFQRSPKTEQDMVFDRLNTAQLNKHLQNLMPGLTAKVFRTFNASFVFQQQLRNTPKYGTEAEKILAYNRANRQVAILCNHQRSVSKGFQGQMTRIQDRLLVVRYQRKLLKDHLLHLAPGLKKQHPELAEKEPDLTDEWIHDYLLLTCESDREKVQKKFERDNEKLKEAGEEPLTQSRLDEMISEINDREKKIKMGKYKPEPPVGKSSSTDKILEKVDKLTDRIKKLELDMIEKDENKTTALSTSKINYIDPRISMTWCKKYDVPVDKIFNKALREKFNWALEMDSTWEF